MTSRERHGNGSKTITSLRIKNEGGSAARLLGHAVLLDLLEEVLGIGVVEKVVTNRGNKLVNVSDQVDLDILFRERELDTARIGTREEKEANLGVDLAVNVHLLKGSVVVELEIATKLGRAVDLDL